jgi:hypothetical protein
LRKLFWNKLKIAAVYLVLAATLATGLGALAQFVAQANGQSPTAAPQPGRDVAEEGPRAGLPQPEDRAWRLSLREAIRVGLNHSVTALLLAAPADGPYLIAPRNPRPASAAFQADVMAEVRSIEQSYWSLADRNARLSAAEAAATLGEQILRGVRAKTELGPAVPNVTEAQENLDRFRLDVVAETEVWNKAERQIRKVIGISSADQHRIVCTTAPLEAKRELDWVAVKARNEPTRHPVRPTPTTPPIPRGPRSG